MKKILLTLFIALAFVLPVEGQRMAGSPIGTAPPDDTAYDATTWNASRRSATKNAIRDQIEAILAGTATFTALTVNGVLTVNPDGTNETFQVNDGTLDFTDGNAGTTGTATVDSSGNISYNKNFAAVDLDGIIGSNTAAAGTFTTVTVGDGSAGDKQINFDADANDWHVGRDDTDDFFKIGLGTALGTTDYVTIAHTTGYMGLGTASPDYQLHQAKDGASVFHQIIAHSNTASHAGRLILGHTRGTEASPTATQLDDTIGVIAAGGWDTADTVMNAIVVEAAANWGDSATDSPTRIKLITVADGTSTESTAVLIDDSQNVLVGHTTAQITQGQTSRLQSIGTGTAASFSISRFSNDSGAPTLNFAKSKNPTTGSHTAVTDNTDIGQIAAAASDGTDFGTVPVRIDFQVDDLSPAASSIGGALLIRTAKGLSSDDLTDGLIVSNTQTTSLLGPRDDRLYTWIEEFDDEAAAVQWGSGLNADAWTTAGMNYAAANVTYLSADHVGGALEVKCAAADNDSVNAIKDAGKIVLGNDPILEVRVKIDDITTVGWAVGFAGNAFNDLNTGTNEMFMIGQNTDQGAANVYLITNDNGGGITYDDTGIDAVNGTYLILKIDGTDTEQPRVWINQTEIAAGSITGTIKATANGIAIFHVQNLAGGAIQRVMTMDYMKTWATR